MQKILRMASYTRLETMDNTTIHTDRSTLTTNLYHIYHNSIDFEIPRHKWGIFVSLYRL